MCWISVRECPTETSEEVFENEEGSKNLITYQGDLNYDGRVSFKDLAYLNAGAARQELVDKVDASGKEVRIRELLNR